MRFREDKCIRLEFLENGEQRTKMISADILFNCLAKSLSDTRITTGLLPDNAVSVTVDEDHGQRYAVLEFPEERAAVTYMNTEYPNFPLPRLLFGFRIEDSGQDFRRQPGCAGSRKAYTGHQNVLLPVF